MLTTWYYDSSRSKSNLLSHISHTHFFPSNIESMNVRRTFQMFGKRMAEAMELAAAAGELTSPTWKKTKQFILKLNDNIDYCNSSKQYNHNINKRPLSSENPHILKEMK